MIKSEDTNRLQKSWPWWRLVLTVLNIIALLLSLILSWHYLSGDTLAGCIGGSSCETVLNSRWALLGGVLPVSSLAVGTYLSLLVAGFFISPDYRHLYTAPRLAGYVGIGRFNCRKCYLVYYYPKMGHRKFLLVLYEFT